MTTSIKRIYRQGDVALVVVDEIPANVELVPRDKERGVVLAEGEATGHAHRIPSRHANLYRTEADQRYMRVTAGVQLTHEEHKTRCHTCPELPLTLATHYDAVAKLAPDRERERYTCDEHRPPSASPIIPGSTYLPPGNYHRTLDADYVPGELPRNVAD